MLYYIFNMIKGSVPLRPLTAGKIAAVGQEETIPKRKKLSDLCPEALTANNENGL